MENRDAGARRTAARIARLTGLLTLLTFGIAVFTPPLSGPFCLADCFSYPYHGIGGRFPRDYYWMVPAILLTLLYVALLAGIHEFSAPERRLYSRTGLAFGILAAAVLVPNMFVQLAVVPPSLQAGETEGLALLTQFNPHGLFIALEETGYLVMSLSLACLAPVFAGAGARRRVLRVALVAGFVVNLGALLVLSAQHGVAREYRFEVLVISVDWLVLALTGFLAAPLFLHAETLSAP